MTWALLPDHQHDERIARLLKSIDEAINEYVFDLVQDEFDRRRDPSDGYCPECGSKPLTLGQRARISGPIRSYMEDAATVVKMRGELDKADHPRSHTGKT